MLRYISCLRPLNLVIIYATQLLVYYSFFLKDRYFIKLTEGIPDWVLAPPRIHVFGLVTVLIAASGYLINDYFDFDSDLANNKKHRLPSKTANLIYYWLVVTLGFLLALYLAYDIGRVLLSGIYLIAVACLFLYSAIWKKRVLIGNIVVSLFSAFVILIFLYAEKDLLFLISTQDNRQIITQLIIYSLFAFLISMVREIIKDIEDVDGDRAAGYGTLAVVHGEGRAKALAAFYCICLLLVIGFWMYILNQSFGMPISALSLGGVLVLHLLYVLYKLNQNSTNFPAKQLSAVCKIIMLLGLVFLIFTQV